MTLNRIKNFTWPRLTFGVIMALGLLPGTASAKGGGHAPAPSIFENQLALVLLVIMVILLLAIILLSHVLGGAADIYRQKLAKEKAIENNTNPVQTAVVTGLLLLVAGTVSAQQPVAEALTVASPQPSIPASALYVMVGVIAIELLVLIIMLQQLKNVLGIRSKKRLTFKAVHISNPLKNLWEKLNDFNPVEKEADIELDHNYDGIKELDNKLPPWWLYGFYATIIFAGIYLWRYHVAETGLTQTQEYELAMKHADEMKAEYLKKSANLVDENTVKMLASPADLAIGKGIFESTCSPCHGKAGEGIVGPNLTDDYWLNGGNIKDVFKTIKYGVPEKGMRSWKDDFSPVQLAQIASYIKSIHGTNPPNPKEQQGELYKEEPAATGDSSAVKTADVVSATK